MKAAEICKHTAIVIAAILLFLGVPFFSSDYFAAALSGVDAISSSSVALDAPSGFYIVLINADLHTDTEALAGWISYFEGSEDYPFFEDLVCAVAEGDTGAQDMAVSFQSRLPQNQMKIKTTTSTMLLSRIEHDLFDIVVMSREFADTYLAEASYTDAAIVLEVGDTL